MNTPARNGLSVGDLTVLTDRQREVATLACQGLCNKTIGKQLGLTEGTVKIHLHAIFKKLGVRSRAGLINSLWQIAASSRFEQLDMTDLGCVIELQH